jgi:hypothetical protein
MEMVIHGSVIICSLLFHVTLFVPLLIVTHSSPGEFPQKKRLPGPLQHVFSNWGDELCER